MAAASTSSSSQPGPSSGIRSPLNETQCFVDTDLFDFLLTEDLGDGAGPRIRKLLRYNMLKIVPDGGTDEDEEQKRRLKREVANLKDELTRVNRVKQDLSDDKERAKEMEKKAKEMEAKLERVSEEMQGLRRRCANLEGENRRLHAETTIQQDKFQMEQKRLEEENKKCVEIKTKWEKAEKRAHMLAENLRQAMDQSKEENEKILKEKEELVNDVKQIKDLLQAERNESERKIQQEQEKAYRFQQSMLQRSEQVVALKDEMERWTTERIRFKLFLEKLGTCCGYPISNGTNQLLECGALDNLMSYVEQFLKARNRDKIELERIRSFTATGLQSFLSQAQELVQSLYGPASNVPDNEPGPSSSSQSNQGSSITNDIPAFRPMPTTCPDENRMETTVQSKSPQSRSPIQDTSQDGINDSERAESPPIAVIVGVSTVTAPGFGVSTPSKPIWPLIPTPPPEEIIPPRKRSLTPDFPTPNKRVSFPIASEEIDIVHKVEVISLPNTPVKPSTSPIPTLTVIKLPQPTAASSNATSTRPRAEVAATPRNETPLGNQGSSSTPLQKGPSIVVPLLQGSTQAQELPSVIPLPSTSPQGANDQQPQPTKASKRRISNGSRLYKQFSPFANTNKQHGINRARAQHSCLCGNVYQNEKGLKVHIRKMTKEWKYKCTACLQYFFYQSDLSRHQKVTEKCSKKINETAKQGSFTSFLDDLLSSPPPQQPVATKPNSTFKPSRKYTTPRKVNIKRKLQQSIFRNKKHVPWSKQSVNGSWFCTCGSKFSCKPNLQMHCQYFTREWQFRCEQCPEKYFFLSYLRKHMKQAHGIQDAFKEYKCACHLCGEMFVRRKDYHLHKKLAHDVQSPLAKRARGLMSQRISSQAPVVPSQASTNDQEPAATSSPTTQDIYNISTVDDDLEDITIVKVVRTSPTKNPTPVASTPITVPPTPQVPPSPRTTYPQDPKHVAVEPDPLSMEPDAVKIFKCKCGKTYLSKTALNHHIKKMTVGNIYVCLKCSRAFQELCNLKTHMSTIHQESYKGFSCAKCKKRFVNALVFEKHRRDEHEEIINETYDTDIDMLD